MERTVPRSATEEVDLYLRTIYSLLRSTTEVQIRTLEEVHIGMDSVLHINARKETPDPSAFFYSHLRLPGCMPEVSSIVLGQTPDLFVRAGYHDIGDWKPAPSRARRRRCFFNGKSTLACYIASRSDIDDIVPAITAYQIEWNKLNLLLQRVPRALITQAAGGDHIAFAELAERLLLSVDDLMRFKAIWQERFADNLRKIATQRLDIAVRLLGGSLSHYWRATRAWWDHVETRCPELLGRPLYFISSNTHSIVNLLSGFPLSLEDELIAYLQKSGDSELIAEWENIQARRVRSSRENFLYYLFRQYKTEDVSGEVARRMEEHERQNGIVRICSEHYFDVDAQVIDLAKLNPTNFDPRLSGTLVEALARSDALLLNIDYPLGLAAYNILAKVAEYANPILGVYIMGKAATLNARLGDAMIPNVVHDEHTQNTYLFPNIFQAADVSPYMAYGTVLDNQKAVSVLGTFLQTAQYMDVFYREGFSDLEMESGPFMSAICEMVRPKRHPVNEIINLYSAPFDIGIIHYVSDTPLSKGRNLGAGTLSYLGMDSTYAASIAILRRILDVECRRARGC